MSNASAFDPQNYLNANQGEVNVKRPPLPIENPASDDGFYTAMIGQPAAQTGIKDEKPWCRIIIPLNIEIPQQVQDQLGIKLNTGTLTISDRVFLNLTEQGLIDNSPGKNPRQRQYRDALDMNKPGQVFNWNSVAGKVVKIRIAHEMYEGEIQERIGTVVAP